jgi:hypothetical protein
VAFLFQKALFLVLFRSDYFPVGWLRRQRRGRCDRSGNCGTACINQYAAPNGDRTATTNKYAIAAD